MSLSMIDVLDRVDVTDVQINERFSHRSSRLKQYML